MTGNEIAIHAERRKALGEELARERAGAMAVIPGPNLVYLTGLHFHLSERPTVALFRAGSAEFDLVVPSLEEGKARAGGAAEVFTFSDEEGPSDAYGALRKRIPDGPLGVEGRRCRFLELELLGRDRNIVNADPWIARLRMRKSATEIDAMRHAAGMAESALAATLPSIRVGQTTELELVAELTRQLYVAGSDPELPFTPLAATGENGSNPHANAGARAVHAGELLTLDWGASAGGYFSDMTRTFRVRGGELPDRLRDAYAAVQEANAAGVAAVRPGVTAGEIDRASRSVIEAAGLGEYFTHRTGHGLGLECHEEPDIKAGNDLVLESGMTFTVEPGVYIPGLGGVRIEDDVVVTEVGGESLTTWPRTLSDVGE